MNKTKHGDTLFLILNRKWFELISTGEKREEYRRVCETWKKKIWDRRHELKKVIFQLGYTKNVRMEYEILSISSHLDIVMDEGLKLHKIWGYDSKVPSYIIKLGRRIA
jgi:hypothetical protein